MVATIEAAGDAVMNNRLRPKNVFGRKRLRHQGGYGIKG